MDDHGVINLETEIMAVHQPHDDEPAPAIAPIQQELKTYIEVANLTRHAVSAVNLAICVLVHGRSVPLVAGDAWSAIPGGLEPRERLVVSVRIAQFLRNFANGDLSLHAAVIGALDEQYKLI